VSIDKDAIAPRSRAALPVLLREPVFGVEVDLDASIAIVFLSRVHNEWL